MLSKKLVASVAAVFTVAVVAACNEAPVTSPGAEADANSTTEFIGGGSAAAKASSEAASQLASIMDGVNAGLEATGENYRVAMVEAITSAESGEIGITVIAKDVGNKQLGADFVPGDGRRAWSGGGGNAITYAIDQTGDAVPVFGGLTGAQTDAAIERSMATWDAETCSDLGLSRNPDFAIDIGFVAALNGLGGSFNILADVQHAGWRDINFAGGVIGATFTFIFVAGPPTDIDGNGLADVAFREIYYDPSFSWADDGIANIDVETVALHEVGHGLSQAHFGQVFVKKKGALQFAPRAVMNAVYVGPFPTLAGTDGGGHCSNWAQWPNN